MDDNEGSKHLYDVVNDFDVAMLVTYTGDAIHARPMAMTHLDNGIGAYLVTNINSLKVDEISANPTALLTFQSARKFASVRGELTVLHDRQLIEKMWKETWKVWFPGGKTDSKLCLLKVDAERAEYWDNSGIQGLKYLFEGLKSVVLKKRPETDQKQNAKVTL